MLGRRASSRHPGRVRWTKAQRCGCCPCLPSCWHPTRGVPVFQQAGFLSSISCTPRRGVHAPGASEAATCRCRSAVQLSPIWTGLLSAGCPACTLTATSCSSLHLALQGEWLYMIESDYVFMKPLPLPDAQSQAREAALCVLCALRTPYSAARPQHAVDSCRTPSPAMLHMLGGACDLLPAAAV